MKDDTLIIECGAAQTRAALISGGSPNRFWFGPTIDDKTHDDRALAGREFIGRIKTINRALNAAFVDIGADKDCFVQLAKGNSHAEGALVRVRVISPARQSKGPVGSIMGASNSNEEIGRRGEFLTPPVEAATRIGAEAAIVVDDPVAAAQLLEAGFECELASGVDAQSLFAAFNADEALAVALAQTVALPGGGALHFSETQALVAIDVDTGVIEAPSTDRLREKVISAAAKEVALQISRRNLAGRVAVDFPSVKNPDVRARCVNLIQKALRSLPGVSSINIARGNFSMLMIERSGPTLWDEASESLPGVPVSGRRFTLDWLVSQAINEAETRQRREPGTALTIHAGCDLHNALQQRDNAFERFSLRHGRRLALVLSPSMEARSYDISEQ